MVLQKYKINVILAIRSSTEVPIFNIHRQFLLVDRLNINYLN